ncbi:S-adenosyl-L-methionine-dependent methyltransferase [Trematosphaeria pertusa]|uniref:S-adenosyl-L-methionine-dependent methyltransferase n=1 Tax=Trematosphaeria pertusa TaxID=390896 RepID=A0A6A6J430_9PLEO|nr:S-adenosyl-L-methionine-dependent methyltransferase [Trematosphaeria pertusa]KAF2257171.1 S-adenosyl-L-methionine-dependent methyltransferase [Trematosphaeria pertusa]
MRSPRPPLLSYKALKTCFPAPRSSLTIFSSKLYLHTPHINLLERKTPPLSTMPTYQGQRYEQDPRWTAVDAYSLSHLHPKSATTPSHDALEYAQTNAEQNGLPDIAVSTSQGKFLQLQARLARAKNILELGTLGGFSTLWLAHASPDVKVTSVEVDPHHAEVARANFKNAGVADRVDVRLGPGVEVLPKIAEEVKQGKHGKFQLVFIDADKENNWNYVDMALGMCEPGACIIVDNVVRKGQLANEGGDERIQGARRVVENIGKDARLDGVVIQTVGEKSYDGFLMAVVK